MANKHDAAIERQQYTPKLIAGTCGNCTHRKAVTVLPAWMRGNPEYTPETHGVESNTCGIGGFPVKKLGSCCEHAFEAESA